jgi:hypothetical protein
MSNIVNASFFIGDINIPNLGNTAIIERLNSFVAKYEEQCFTELFGYAFYKLYKDNVSSERMMFITDGSEYSGCFGDLQNWEGIVVNENTSFLAFYIYYYFQQSSATLTTGVSTAAAHTDGASSVSPAEKMVYAWNEYSEIASSLLNFLWFKKDSANQRLYPEFTAHQLRKSASISRKINIFSI